MTASWEREKEAKTAAECRSILTDQLPFHFADPRDPRIEDVRTAMVTAAYSPDVLRAAANEGYGGIEVEDRLKDVTHPVLVLAGRHDRACSVEAAEAIARDIGAQAELHVFEDAGHLTFVEQPGEYVDTVLDFLGADSNEEEEEENEDDSVRSLLRSSLFSLFAPVGQET